MLELQNGGDSDYKEWKTDGSIKKRELLEALKEIGDDDEIYLNVSEGGRYNVFANTVELFRYSKQEGDCGQFDLTISRTED